jgi:hypothetical protein
MALDGKCGDVLVWRRRPYVEKVSVAPASAWEGNYTRLHCEDVMCFEYCIWTTGWLAYPQVENDTVRVGQILQEEKGRAMADFRYDACIACGQAV